MFSQALTKSNQVRMLIVNLLKLQTLLMSILQLQFSADAFSDSVRCNAWSL